MRISRSKVLAIGSGMASLFLVRSAVAQSDPQGMLQIFADASVNWQNTIFPYAVNLFKLLAVADFAWTCITNALEKSDIQALIASIIKKLMTIGLFYALLVFAPTWFPKIIQSFVQLGGAAAGVPTPLNPSDVFKMGATIAGTLLDAAATNTSLLMSFSSSLALIFAAAIILASYVVITVHFVMAMVESYLLVGAGYIFLGFGGSRWTSSYAERYVSQVVSVGSRLMVLYLIIGLGQQFATQWLDTAKIAAVGATSNVSLTWTLASQVAIYAVIAWTVPKLVSNVIGGTLSASAGDAIAIGVAAGTAALSGAAMISGVGAPAAAAGGASAVSSVANAAGAANAAGGAASVGPAGTAAGAGVLTGGTTAAQGSSSLAKAADSSSAGVGGDGGGSSASMSRGGSATQPSPPASTGRASSASSQSSLSPAGERILQPPPPAHALAAVDARSALNKAKEAIRGVHGSLPSDGAIASGAGLSMGHAAE